jgi:hypothetical protein
MIRRVREARASRHCVEFRSLGPSTSRRPPTNRWRPPPRRPLLYIESERGITLMNCCGRQIFAPLAEAGQLDTQREACAEVELQLPRSAVGRRDDA